MEYYKLEEAREQVVRAGKELLESGLIARTWGNISARISDNEFVITPSGRDYETLKPSDVVIVSIADGSYQGHIKPSSEYGVHQVAYQLHDDVCFVIHTHQSNASAISVLGKGMSRIAKYGQDKENILGPKVPCASYGLSATRRLKRNMEAAIYANLDCNSILMRNHGVLCMGRDYEDAFLIAHTLENISAKKFHRLTGCVEEEMYSTGSQDAFYEVMEESWMKELQHIDAKNTATVAIHTKTPFVLRMSLYGNKMRPYIDDLAQIAGTCIQSLPEEASFQKIAKALRHSDAVLIQGQGAYCIGSSLEEAKAVCMVLEKGAKAAYLAKMIGRIPPIDFLSAQKERYFYVLSYSKLK